MYIGIYIHRAKPPAGSLADLAIIANARAAAAAGPRNEREAEFLRARATLVPRSLCALAAAALLFVLCVRIRRDGEGLIIIIFIETCS